MEISIVVPVLNEEGNIPLLCERLQEVLTTITQEFEIVFVDDGSTDSTFEVIKNLSGKDPRIVGIAFSRNFGHQIALLAGIRRSKGQVVITMDGDMQHPPEAIPILYQKYLEGYDIVNTKRKDDASIGVFKKMSSRLFYRFMNYLSEIRINPGSADFRLMNRQSVDAFISIPERDRFTRGLVSWMGFTQAVVEYQARPRASGNTKYSIGAMIRFGLSGITSFSSRPLRLSFYLGISISVIGFVYALFAIVMFFNGRTIEGWASILVSLLIIGGVILVSLGVIGEYISRIFHEVKSRPLYFIRDQTDDTMSK